MENQGEDEAQGEDDNQGGDNDNGGDDDQGEDNGQGGNDNSDNDDDDSDLGDQDVGKWMAKMNPKFQQELLDNFNKLKSTTDEQALPTDQGESMDTVENPGQPSKAISSPSKEQQERGVSSTGINCISDLHGFKLAGAQKVSNLPVYAFKPETLVLAKVSDVQDLINRIDMRKMEPTQSGIVIDVTSISAYLWGMVVNNTAVLYLDECVNLTRMYRGVDLLDKIMDRMQNDGLHEWLDYIELKDCMTEIAFWATRNLVECKAIGASAQFRIDFEMDEEGINVRREVQEQHNTKAGQYQHLDFTSAETLLKAAKRKRATTQADLDRVDAFNIKQTISTSELSDSQAEALTLRGENSKLQARLKASHENF